MSVACLPMTSTRSSLPPGWRVAGSAPPTTGTSCAKACPMEPVPSPTKAPIQTKVPQFCFFTTSSQKIVARRRLVATTSKAKIVHELKCAWPHPIERPDVCQGLFRPRPVVRYCAPSGAHCAIDLGGGMEVDQSKRAAIGRGRQPRGWRWCVHTGLILMGMCAVVANAASGAPAAGPHPCRVEGLPNELLCGVVQRHGCNWRCWSHGCNRRSWPYGDARQRVWYRRYWAYW